MKYYTQKAFSILLFLFIVFTCDAAIIYVDIDAPFGGDGSSWATAYDNLSEAVGVANNGDAIWMAEGEYEEYMSIYTDLGIYGGFDGSETLLSQRDVFNHKSIILNYSSNPTIYIHDYSVNIDGVYFDGAAIQAINTTFYNSKNQNVVNCTFTGSYEQSVVGLRGASITLANCVFYDLYVDEIPINSDVQAYLIFLNGVDVEIVNNTIINNENSCTTIKCLAGVESLNISNNIIQDETDFLLNFNSQTDLTFDFTFNNNVLMNDIIATGYGCSGNYTAYELIDQGENNLIYTYKSDDFLDIDNNDFRLSECSAFINVGNNDEILTDEDFVGNDRIGGGTVDAGAFETDLINSLIYVDVNATGANNGSSWLDAYTDLQVAALASTCNSEIWVSQGIYRIDDDGVKLKNNAKIFGGFNGTQGQLDQRDWDLYPTILTGNFNSTSSHTDDAPSLIVLDGSAKSKITIDGFTMRKTYSFNDIQPVIQSSVLKTNIYLNNIIIKNNKNELMQHSGNIFLSNVLIDDNSASELFLSYLGGDFKATNCTFVNNNNTILSANFAGNVNFKNCLFWKNEDAEINANGADNVLFVNNNFDTLVIDAPDIDSTSIYHYDPLFVDENNDDFSLGDCSPLIDLGVEDFDLPTYDLSRNERQSNGQIDIGAYEFEYPSSSIIYVDLTATGSDNGSTWPNAYTDLQDAITEATQGSEIWVAQGTYYPYDLASPDPSDRFLLECGVSMYGGFAGFETSLDERDPDTYITTLSGRDVGSGNIFSYHVLRLKDFTADAIVDGFTIEGGYATNASVTHGAGIWMSNSLGTVNNCKIKNNLAERGGAIAIINSPKGNIRNCEITFNEAEIEGGAIYVKNSSFISRNNIYAVNLSLAGEAGGILFEDSYGVMKNNRMNNNVAINGGAMKSINSEIDIDYSSIINNAAVVANNGSVLEVDSNSDILISNSIIHGNETDGSINNFSGNTSGLEIVNSIVEGNWLGDGSDIIDEDPMLEDYIPKSCSPAIDIGSLENMPLNDITLKSRVHGNGPDLGAYEQRNPYYINGQAGPDKIVCNSTTFEIPYGLERLDTLYTDWDGTDQVSGVMFDVIFDVPVKLEAVSAHFDCSGLATNNVYYKQGSYQGSEITSTDWILIHTSIMTAANNCALGDTFMLATDPVLFESGKRYGIYVSSARLVTPTNYVYSSNDPTAGFGDTLYTDDLYTIFHGRGTRDFQFDTPTAGAQMFEGGLHISRYDSISWYKDDIFLATGDTLEVASGLPPGIYDYEAQVFIADGCSYVDTLQVIAYETIPNDLCEDATALDLTPIDSLGGVSKITSNNLCAGASAGSGSCNVSSGRDVWYKFNGTESSRLTIVLDNIFPITDKFNPSITVLEGTCGSFTEIACVDDFGNEESETVHLTNLDPESGYYIIVDGKNTQMGIYDLTFIDPCLSSYLDYDPLADQIGSCLNQDIILSSDLTQIDTLSTNESIFSTDKFGIYFNIVADKTVNIHRISSKLVAHSGVRTYHLYTRHGDALTAIDDVSKWDTKGAFFLTDPTADIYEIPLDIDEVITIADTLGVFLYCTSVANPGIHLNFGSKIENDIANTDQTVHVLYGKSSDGPAFTNNIGLLEAWQIGDVFYEEVETVSWYKNGSFLSNDYDLTVTPVDFDEYILHVIDNDQCKFMDTTIVRTEGKIVQNTNDDGWQSLRSVVGCAEWGVDTITFDPALIGENIKLKSAITFEAPNNTNNQLFIKGFAPNNRMKISGSKSYINNLFNVNSNSDTELIIANIDFRNSINHIKNYGSLLLQDVTIVDNDSNDRLISNFGQLKLKNNILLQKPKDDDLTNGHIQNENGTIKVDGEVTIIKE